MITFKQQSYPWDVDRQHMPTERVEMSTYDEIDYRDLERVEMSTYDDINCRDLVDFFSRFAKALGYSPNSVYVAFEEYLVDHKKVK